MFELSDRKLAYHSEFWKKKSAASVTSEDEHSFWQGDVEY